MCADSRTKGLTEQDLASLGYETIIFRPGFLRVKGGRSDAATSECVYGYVSKYFVSKLSSQAEIGTDELDIAMVKAGEIGVEGCLKAGLGAMLPLGKDQEKVRIRIAADSLSFKLSLEHIPGARH